jgi:hypothetical protein
MTDLWWLKLKRAQCHVVEIKRMVRCYVESHPYEVVRVRQPEGKQHRWLYALHMTRQPDPMLAIIFGEFIHNLRSALDNIVVASAPSKYKYTSFFPISTEDVLEQDSLGNYVFRQDDNGERFSKAIRGLPLRAQAIVEKVQPYRTFDDRETHSLGLLSRLDNADKHRGAVALGSGLSNAAVRTLRGAELTNQELAPTRHQLIDDGAKVIGFESRTLTDSEVDVQIRGTACVTVKIVPMGGNQPAEDFRLQSALWQPLTDVRWVLRQLEPFVRR